jgi:ABC-type transport system involved in cytochrome bd biosynthesis fused ATPase/permease subunit
MKMMTIDELLIAVIFLVMGIILGYFDWRLNIGVAIGLFACLILVYIQLKRLKENA